jgi:hypothetical protein
MSSRKRRRVDDLKLAAQPDPSIVELHPLADVSFKALASSTYKSVRCKNNSLQLYYEHDEEFKRLRVVNHEDLELPGLPKEHKKAYENIVSVFGIGDGIAYKKETFRDGTTQETIRVIMDEVYTSDLKPFNGEIHPRNNQLKLVFILK